MKPTSHIPSQSRALQRAQILPNKRKTLNIQLMVEKSVTILTWKTKSVIWVKEFPRLPHCCKSPLSTLHTRCWLHSTGDHGVWTNCSLNRESLRMKRFPSGLRWFLQIHNIRTLHPSPCTAFNMITHPSSHTGGLVFTVCQYNSGDLMEGFLDCLG